MNLEQCFTASITSHSVSILSELKTSSFGPYTDAKTNSPLHQLCYQLHSVEGRAKCSFLNVVNWRLLHALLDKAVN